MLRRACCQTSIASTSSRNTRSSRREPCEACRTPLPAHSRSSIRFRNSRRPPSWGNFSVNCLHDPYDPVHGCDSASGIGSPSLPADLIRSTPSKPVSQAFADHDTDREGFLHPRAFFVTNPFGSTKLKLDERFGGDNRPTIQNWLLAESPDLARSSEVFYYSSAGFLTV